MIAIYARVSTKGQDTASQETDLKAWAKGKRGVAWYRDQFTGTSMDRPAFNRMMEAVAVGKVSTIVVWRLDRLGRTAKGLTALFDDLVKQKVNLVSLRDGLDLSTPAGRLMANVLASVAAYETEVRSERQRAGIEAARARGVKFGRPDGTGKPISLTPEKRANVRHLKAQGMKVAKIARMMRMSRTTVYEVLKNGETT